MSRGGLRNDAEEIRQLLTDRIEDVISDLSPGWKKRGNKAYLTPKNDKDLGSFTVSLSDQGNRLPRGSWYRFSQRLGGGSVELVSYLLYNQTNSYAEAFAWARTKFGLSGAVEESPEDRADRERRQEISRADRADREEKHNAEVAKKKEERKHSAADVWAATKPLAGTHGEAYLMARGLPALKLWPWDCSDTIRFHPNLDYELDYSVGRMPAVVAKVVDAFGDLIAVWQIYLDKDKPMKARIANAKVGRGPAQGGAIRIGGDGPHIGTAEGMETALGAWFLECCRYPIWSCMSTSGVIGFEFPVFVKRHTGWQDGDKAILKKSQVLMPPGEGAARKLQASALAIGIPSVINDMCRDGDALDLYNTLSDHEKGERLEPAA